MNLFDAHCHLQDARLAPHLDGAMARAAQAGVTSLMCCGSRETDWPLLPGIAGRFPGVHLSFGLHPWFVGDRSERWLDSLKTFLAGTPSSVGEIGLDHALDQATFADQETVLLAQIHLANERHRPVTLHCRRAWGRLMELLDEKGWPAHGFMLHSYSGSAELIQPLTRRGAFFSFSGAITFEQNRKGREAVVAVPSDRLLIETDSPDLEPDVSTLHDDKGKPINEPAHLAHILRTISRLRGETEETIATITANNATQLFLPLTISSGLECRPQ